MTQWAAVMTNRSVISAPPQKNTPSRAMATCQVCSPMYVSSLPMILRLSPSLNSSRSTVCSPSLADPKWSPDRLIRPFCKTPCSPPRTAERRMSRCRWLIALPPLLSLSPLPPLPPQRPDSNDGVRCGAWSLKLSSFICRTDGRPQSGDSETKERRRRLRTSVIILWCTTVLENKP